MRRLIVWNLVTLDGYFEGAAPWALDWHEYVWGEELERFSLDQLASADTLLFGRATYQGMAQYWQTAEGEREVADYMNSIAKIVFSRTLEQAEWQNATVAKEPPEQMVARLKQQPGKDILVFGSAELVDTLLRHGLVDEYRLGLTPVILGAGKPLFKASPERLRMKLLEARPLQSGCVFLRYQPQGNN